MSLGVLSKRKQTGVWIDWSEDSPFTTTVQECLVPSKFQLPQLEPFDWLKDP